MDSEPLKRPVVAVEFDASLDDLVDVSMRSLARSKTIRRSKWRSALTTALIAGVVVFAVVQSTFVARLATGIVAAVFGVGLQWVNYENSIRKRLRKLCMEQIGADKAFHVRIELAESRIEVRQLKTGFTFDWSSIKEIDEANDAIYFHRRDGTAFAARKRGFESTEKKDQFIETARRYQAAAQRE